MPNASATDRRNSEANLRQIARAEALIRRGFDDACRLRFTGDLVITIRLNDATAQNVRAALAKDVRSLAD